MRKDCFEEHQTPMCGDLTQAGVFSRASSLIPTLTRNTELFCFSKPHLYTSGELEFSQGWPAEFAPTKFSDAVFYDIHALSCAQRRSLRGNGMHLACIGAWLLYCMSHTKKRSDVLSEMGDILIGSRKIIGNSGQPAVESAEADTGTSRTTTTFSRALTTSFSL